MSKTIFFVGDMRSPFIKQDLGLLGEDNKVIQFDNSIVTKFSLGKAISYLFSCLSQWGKIKESDLIWIWFADYPNLPFVILGKLLHKPVVINIGGWEVEAIPEIQYGNQLSSVRGAITRYMIRNSTKTMIPSHTFKNMTLKIVPTANLSVIHTWITLPEGELKPKRDLVVTAYCIRSTKILKGIHTFEAVMEMNPPCQMRVLRNLPHDQLMDILSEAKVYVCGSRTENENVTLLEAMARGCVPVTTGEGGLMEEVSDTGVFFRYGDVLSEYNAIKKALTLSGEPARIRARSFSREKKKMLVKELLEQIHG